MRAGVSLHRLGRGFEALQFRNFRIWSIGQLVSTTGTWMQSTAQAWLVLQLTDLPFAIGLVAVFQFFPVMVLALIGGVIADRLPRYRLVLVTQTLSMILATIFGVLVGTGLIQLWQVYLLAFLNGLVTAIDVPSRQTFAIDLVDREHRANAVALNSMLFNASRIIGPALAGLLIGPLGIATILYVNAASFLAVLVGLLAMDTSGFDNAVSRSTGTMVERLREGLRYVRRTPEVLQVMILVGAIGTFGYNFSVILPLISGFILHTDAAGFGAMGTALGLGSLAASLLMAYTRKLTIARLAAAGRRLRHPAGRGCGDHPLQRHPGAARGHGLRRRQLQHGGQHPAAAARSGRAPGPGDERLLAAVHGQHAGRRAVHRGDGARLRRPGRAADVRRHLPGRRRRRPALRSWPAAESGSGATGAGAGVAAAGAKQPACGPPSSPARQRGGRPGSTRLRGQDRWQADATPRTASCPTTPS